MAQSRDIRDVSTHIRRADRHFKVGDALHAAGDEWAAVCFFYSAYHVVKAALLTDAVFDDIGALKALNTNLTPDDRYSTRHQGARGLSSPVLGINEIVGLLYPGVAAQYRLLHMASVQVRYKDSLATTLDDCKEYSLAVRDAFETGQLVYGANN